MSVEGKEVEILEVKKNFLKVLRKVNFNIFFLMDYSLYFLEIVVKKISFEYYVNVMF